MNIILSNEIVNVSKDSQIAWPCKDVVNKSYREVVCEALDFPVDCLPLSKQDLRGMKVCIIIDDWGRPTEASEFLVDVLERLMVAGAKEEDITLVTASGMHEPMESNMMKKKVGDEVFKRIHCVSHDGGNKEMLKYVGISELGSPIWVNKYVAEADYKIAFGRIHPHCCYGYEGGYKMIVPGVASFETIIRDHSLNFSKLSNYGMNINNPSRMEADAIGRLVGIDFIVNFVMDFNQKAVIAYGGTVETVFKMGVDYGQKNVWCDKTVDKADIVLIASSEVENNILSNNPIYAMGLAQIACKEDSIIIAKMDNYQRKKEYINGLPLDEMSLSDLLLLHEKRNWDIPPRDIQYAIKSIRGEFYYRRAFELRTQKLFLVAENYSMNQLIKWNASRYESIQDAYDAAVSKKSNPKILIIPEADQTLPIIEYDY